MIPTKIIGRWGFPGRFLPSLDALSTPFLVAASQTEIKILANTYIKVINDGVHTIIGFGVDTTFAIATILDTGAIEAGQNYYVYLCNDGQIKVSLNATYPAGYTAANSRKIGGFHSYCCATGSIPGHSLDGFATGAILPASVWCLNHRTWGKQEGTVWDDKTKKWVPIYMISSTGPTTASVFGATITDTRNWMDLGDDLAAVGWRHIGDEEFASAAEGSNQKTNIYGSADPVTNGKCAIYLSKTGTWAAGAPTSAWINRTAYVPPGGAANEAQEYKITISTGDPVNPNFLTYQKRNPAGVLGAASNPVQIAGAAQALADGLLITFPAAVGWVTGETATFVVMNGMVNTDNRRMVSNIGVEGACGVMSQWLRDQSYRFDRGAVAYVAGSQTTTLYHAAAPGGNPIYVKETSSGIPYLCCNLAAAGLNKVLSFGTYRVLVIHDAAAADGLPLYFDYDATLPYRFLINNTISGKNIQVRSNDPNYNLYLKHDASAATNGVAVNYDDGADNQLEYISPGAANATMDLSMSHTEPQWGQVNPGGDKGQLYVQGAYGSVKVRAGGNWSSGVNSGSRSRDASYFGWYVAVTVSARGCAEPR